MGQNLRIQIQIYISGGRYGSRVSRTGIRLIPTRKDPRTVEVAAREIRGGSSDRAGSGDIAMTELRRQGPVFELLAPRNVPAPHTVSVERGPAVRR